MRYPLDVIGDVHGQLAALNALARVLGYDPDRGFHHPDGRLLVFVGDLVDRGPDSLRVAEKVRELVQAGRAICLMGNHEYNLVGYTLGFERPRRSNEATIAEVVRLPERWGDVIPFLRSLPLAIELPDLRIIHAVWHRPCFERVERALRPPRPLPSGTPALDWLRSHVVLASPFGERLLLPDLPREPAVPPGRNAAHEILIRGYEMSVASPLGDVPGDDPSLVRVGWWDGAHPEIPSDKVTVFGHYWNLPPIAGAHDAFVPPHPRGTQGFRDWHHSTAALIPPDGLVDVPASVRFVCVDYSGVSSVRSEWRGNSVASCVGAYRWPEHQVAWARVQLDRGGVVTQFDDR